MENIRDFNERDERIYELTKSDLNRHFSTFQVKNKNEALPSMQFSFVECMLHHYSINDKNLHFQNKYHETLITNSQHTND